MKLRIFHFLKTYPLSLLLLGPPLWRSFGERSPTATLEGDVDYWVALQILTYLAVGVLALWQIRLRLPKGRWPERAVRPVILAAGLWAGLFLSSLYAPAPMATASTSILFLIGLVAVASFILTAARDEMPVLNYLEVLRAACVILALLVLGSYYLGIGDVMRWDGTELRMFGGRIAYLPTVAWFLFGITLYFTAIGRDSLFVGVPLILLSLFCVYLTKTRAIYILIAYMGGAIGLLWLWQSRNSRELIMRMVIASSLALLLAIGLLLSSIDIWSSFTRGDTETFSNLSGRTLIHSWAYQQLSGNPLGIGYATGFRDSFLRLDPGVMYDFHRQGLATWRIGNMHNAHLEILVGAGWHTFFFYISLVAYAAVALLWSLRRAQRNSDLYHAGLLTSLLLAGVAMHGYVYSDYSFPPYHSFAFVLWLMGLVFIVRERTLAEIQARMPSRPRPAKIRYPGDDLLARMRERDSV